MKMGHVHLALPLAPSALFAAVAAVASYLPVGGVAPLLANIVVTARVRHSCGMYPVYVAIIGAFLWGVKSEHARGPVHKT